MRSLRRQLLRTLALMLLAVFVTQGFVLYGALAHLNESQTLMHLSHDGDSVLSAIGVDAQGRLALDEQRVESVYRLPGSGQYFVVQVQGGGRIASTSLDGFEPELRLPRPGGELAYVTAGPGGSRVQVLEFRLPQAK